MSDHYFNCAREAGCIGLKKTMKGFHACASENNCFKNGKPKKGKKKKAPSADQLQDLVNALGVSGSGKAIGGCGSCSPWITHVKAYQSKYGCIRNICSYEKGIISKTCILYGQAQDD